MFYRISEQFWVWEDRDLLSFSLSEFDNLSKTISLNENHLNLNFLFCKMRSFNLPNYQDLWDTNTELDAKKGIHRWKSQIESLKNSVYRLRDVHGSFHLSMLILISFLLLHDYTELKYRLKSLQKNQIKFGFINLPLWISNTETTVLFIWNCSTRT